MRNIVLPIALTGLLLSCAEGRTEKKTVEIVFNCTNNSSSFLRPDVHAVCRVKTTEGKNVTVYAPVAPGDIIWRSCYTEQCTRKWHVIRD